MSASKLSRRERLELLMESKGWSRVFADEYLLQREYHGYGHEQAFMNVMGDPFVNEQDKPKAM